MITHSHDVIVSNVSGVWPTSRAARYRRTGRYRSVKVGQDHMPHNMTHDMLEQTLAAMCGSYALDVGDSVRTLSTSLPGKAVCAILADQGDGVTRIVFDLDKPYVFGHVQAMLREWWESYSMPVAFPDGTVELIARPAPRKPEGRVHLSFAG